MKKYFLVDYENVESAGLEGFAKLSPDDVVEVFYTEKSNRLSIDFFELYLSMKDTAPRLILTKVAKGNQALDMQLSSYLGSLVAGNGSDGFVYIIVSKDKGYGVLQQFWKKKRPDISITQQDTLKLPQETKNVAKDAAPGEAPVKEKSIKEEAPKTPESKDVASDETLAGENQKPKDHEGKALASSKKTGSVKEKQKAAPKPKEQTQPENQPEATLSQADARTALNNQIITALSKAKCESKEMGIVASLVVNSVLEPNSKTVIYRGLVTRFGQKKGLEFYRLIKGFI